jgi:prepilin-type N-terminal cleavage/methylation domain-containing protein
MKKSSFGFTFVELMVVVGLIAILAAVVIANLSDSSALSRDAERKADLTNLQTAIELYRNEHGRYPKGCNDANPGIDADGDGDFTNDGDAWSGEKGTNFECADGTGRYIVGLAPEFIKTLPTDPFIEAAERNGSGEVWEDSGYVYLTNAEGTVYKMVIRNTIETENEPGNYRNYESDFVACDFIADLDNIDGDSDQRTVECSLTDLPPERNGRCALGVCNMINIHSTCNAGTLNYRRLGDSGYTRCNLVPIRYTYAVWGGYGDPNDVGGNNSDEARVECLTERVICDLP